MGPQPAPDPVDEYILAHRDRFNRGQLVDQLLRAGHEADAIAAALARVETAGADQADDPQAESGQPSAWLTKQDLEIIDAGRSLRATLQEARRGFLLGLITLGTLLVILGDALLVLVMSMYPDRSQPGSVIIGAALTIGLALLLGRAVSRSSSKGTWLTFVGFLGLVVAALAGSCYATLSWADAL